MSFNPLKYFVNGIPLQILKYLLFYQLFYCQLNHQLLLQFFELLFEAVFIPSVVDFLALSRSFWLYVLLNVFSNVSCMCTKLFSKWEKSTYSFTYIIYIYINTDTFSPITTDETFKINKGPLNCNSKKVVYLSECKNVKIHM